MKKECIHARHNWVILSESCFMFKRFRGFFSTYDFSFISIQQKAPITLLLNAGCQIESMVFRQLGRSTSTQTADNMPSAK